jgi:AraC-like DNA-binding protein
VTHESELGSWLIVQREPAPALRRYVTGYSGYRERSRHFGQHLQTASSSIPVIINFGPLFRIDGPRSRDATRRSFVAGLHDGPTLVGSEGCQHCLQINLTPPGARRILSLPMHALLNQTVELDDVLGSRFTGLLAEALYEAPDWDARFDLLDGALLAQLRGAPEVPAGILGAWRHLERHGGNVPIGALAGELGWSNKHLIAQFREHIGLPPKALARILRFERAVALLKRDERACLASAAHAAGYFDQAHLHRDMRQFAGITPGVFLRRRVAGMDGLIGE